MNGGHYTSLAADPVDGDRWFNFNDSVVTPLPPAASVVTKDAYILFYRRCAPAAAAAALGSGNEGSYSRRGNAGGLLLPTEIATLGRYGGVAPTAEGEWVNAPKPTP